MKKRKVTYKEQSESESDNHEDHNTIDKLLNDVDDNSLTNSSTSDKSYFNLFLSNHCLSKRRKITHATSEVVGEIADTANNTTQPLRVLLDSDTSATIVLRPFIAKTSRYKHE